MTLSRVERLVLRYLSELTECKESDLYKSFASENEIRSAVSWLKIKGLIDVEEIEYEEFVPGKNAIEYARRMLPEETILKLLEEENGRVSLEKIREVLREDAGVGIGKMIELGCKIDESFLTCYDLEKIREEINNKKVALKRFVQGDKIEDKYIREFMKRKDFVVKRRRRERKIRITELGIKTIGDLKDDKEEITILSPSIIRSGEWRKYNFRKYDISLYAPEILIGRLHPLTILKKKIREIFISMGFVEIEDRYIQTSFWNMDALFMPQDHPARDMQDTLYVENIEQFETLEESCLHSVKKIHEERWKYTWNPDYAKKLLLRTHTTVNTIRYLHRNKKMPIKVFSIGKVFRRESIDSRHLPEFTQIEGIVSEPTSSLSTLFGVLKEFYRRMGFEKIRLRPSYFPYTEPSLEIEVYFGGEYIELGGAGIFRPEVLEPLGIKDRVLAWGLGLERLAMIVYDVKDIREFYISDIEQLRNFKEW